MKIPATVQAPDLDGSEFVEERDDGLLNPSPDFSARSGEESVWKIVAALIILTAVFLIAFCVL